MRINKKSMKLASRLYRHLKKRFPDLSMWKSDDGEVPTWREIWWDCVSMVLRGDVKPGILGIGFVFSGGVA